MKKFNEWMFEKETKRLCAELFAACFSSEINEVLRIKNLDTRNVEMSKKKLLNHVKQHVGDRDIKTDDVIGTIRHQFTTYDQEWKNFDRLSRNINNEPNIVKFIHPITKQQRQFDLSDLDERNNYWSTLAHAVYDLVEFIIASITNPKNHAHYSRANKAWLDRKLQRVNH